MFSFINHLGVKSVKLAGLALVLAATAGFANAQTVSALFRSGP
jgi:hypothetical protein